MQIFSGYIFDLDGTLVDSNDYHAKAWAESLHEFKYSVVFQQIRPLIGMGSDKLLQFLLDLDPNDEQAKRIADRTLEIFKEKYLSRVVAFKGTTLLVRELKQRGCKLAIASSADESVVKSLLMIGKVEDLFDFVIAGSDVSATKPDRDVVEAALAKLNLPTSHVLMIGDTAYDIQAAMKAGLQTIAFRCGGSSDAELRGALKIFENPQVFLENLP